MNGRPTTCAAALLFALLPTGARADACTCKDIPKIERTLDMIDQTRRAWYSVLADIQGHASDAPGTMDEAVQSFYDKMGWDVDNVRKVGGLDPKTGKTVVDNTYKEQNCDAIVESVEVHESAHRSYYLWRIFTIAAAQPSTLAKILARSEIDARDEQEKFLRRELARVRKTCGTWKCRETQEMFDTAVDCAAKCPHATLAHPAPTCIPIDPKTGKWATPGKGI